MTISSCHNAATSQEVTLLFQHALCSNAGMKEKVELFPYILATSGIGYRVCLISKKLLLGILTLSFSPCRLYCSRLYWLVIPHSAEAEVPNMCSFEKELAMTQPCEGPIAHPFHFAWKCPLTASPDLYN